jgi:hypothetical protein
MLNSYLGKIDITRWKELNPVAFQACTRTFK